MWLERSAEAARAKASARDALEASVALRGEVATLRAQAQAAQAEQRRLASEAEAQRLLSESTHAHEQQACFVWCL